MKDCLQKWLNKILRNNEIISRGMIVGLELVLSSKVLLSYDKLLFINMG